MAQDKSKDNTTYKSEYTKQHCMQNMNMTGIGKSDV
jgi:hypothetical protein